jgi:polyketide biosynthesis acyl carrier protein
MDAKQVFEQIRKIIGDVVPELATRSISMEDSLKELGADSVDRAEILVRSMAALKLKVPLVEFGKAKNIDAIVAIFLRYIKEGAGT